VLASRFSSTPLRILDGNEAYRRRIAVVARDQPERLLAEAFPALDDLATAEVEYRRVVGRAGFRLIAFDAVVEVAREAVRRDIALAEATASNGNRADCLSPLSCERRSARAVP
jgi:hypothetical protein